MLMPSLFVSHGSPTVMIEPESAGRAFLSSLNEVFPKPRAIVVISAHWETDKPIVTGSPQPETIHDFYGFPDELYQKRYPASGDPILAHQVAQLVGGEVDDARGLDHGAWSPLSLIYPKADIPVVQLSLQPMKGAQYHYDIGKRLSVLRKDGVLIMASGSVTHNLRELKWYQNTPDVWALEFENWFVNAIQDNDHDTLLNAPQLAPHYERSHPRDEHWLPVYVALGAARQRATLLHRGFEHQNLSMAAVRFD
ncbi:DODA-type extradiol aromatic ring-opening family dioxygenase [Terasakiella sp.]|uniref:DODA-type extradiol aromatic ring-opening family dioxygenase n=1 Tax=Terasakiella sp. TaxID=2034861 RepID=UPI003AA8E78A